MKARWTPLYLLARDLEVPWARIEQAVRRFLPNHPKLSTLDPKSRLGPRLVRAIRKDVGDDLPTQWPFDPRDNPWKG